ncbi:MAG TPA: hypothetical protein VF794_34665 [Archangium sp.]|uniref:hypothetical protein n=1 Tax=Archangium sp. TaxID=1872627 RepID=UPI002ED8FC47
MRSGPRSLAAALALLVSGSASAVELNYQWKKGDVHRFQYEDDSTIEMKMPGMGANMPGMGANMPGMNMGPGGMNVRMKVQSTFSQKVLAVRPDGTAEMELTLEKMELIGGDKRISTLDKIPAAAKKVKAEVDRKGHAKFFRMVTVYLQEDRTVVGVHDVKAGPTGASASMTAGDTQVKVVAAVNPKTGAISLAMDEKKVPPALKAVQVKEEDPGIDVLPKEIFEMMVLPEGDMTPGGRYEVTTPMGAMATTLSAVEENVAQLHTTVAQETSTAQAEAMANQDSMGDPNMGGMQGGGDMGMKVDVDATSGFDVAAGRLMRIEGTQTIDQSMGGMGGMKVRSRFALQRL